MIKFTAKTATHGTLIGLGISAGNITRLKEGKPIHVNLAELNLPWRGEIMIMYGETENDIQEELKEFIGPETIIHKEQKEN
jgi:hypothetical protein